MKQSNPKFSVIIPVKNGQKYIARSIESILGQSFKNFELIILDNCSNDGTSEIVHSFQDPRMKVFVSEKPLSIEENWSRVLTLELQEYLTIVGYDDVLYPGFLEEIFNLILEDPKASLYHSHFDLIDDNGFRIRACKPIPAHETADQFLYARHHRRRDTFGTGYVMRAEDYRMVGGLLAELPYLIGADDIAWYRLSKLSYKVCSSKYLFAYRYHRRSTSYSIDLLSLNSAFNQYLTLLSKAGYLNNSRNRKAAIKFLQRSFIGRHRRILMETIQDSDPSRWADYWKVKAQLLDLATEGSGFKTQDLSLIILERIGFLPSTIREALICLIEFIYRIVGRRN